MSDVKIPITYIFVIELFFYKFWSTVLYSVIPAYSVYTLHTLKVNVNITREIQITVMHYLCDGCLENVDPFPMIVMTIQQIMRDNCNGYQILGYCP